MNPKKFCCSEKAKDVGLLTLRLSVALIFIYAGYAKLADMERTIFFFSSLSLPIPVFFAYLVSITEFIGGILLIPGILTRTVATTLAIVMVAALILTHFGRPFEDAELAIAMFGSTLALAGVGGGRYRLMQRECLCLLPSKTHSKSKKNKKKG